MPNDCIKRSDALKAILGVSIYDTIEELDGARTIAENTWADGLYDAYKIIEEEVDADDVEPVRHGRWIERDLDSFRKYECACSECGARYIGNYDQYCEPAEFYYCPNCGAKMDKEEDDVHE